MIKLFTTRWILVGVSLLLLVLKLYILHDAFVWAVDPRGDLLMINIADSILHGRWLGEYNEFTLIKGVTYPFFLAISYVVHMPAVMANSFLYLLAIVIFIMAVKPLIKNEIYLFIIYVILLFSPISYATATVQKIYRDDIYYSLILIMVSCYVAIIVKAYNEKTKYWSWLLTLDFIAVMFCREDSIWVVPIMMVFSVLYIKMGGGVNKTSKIVLMPFAGLFVACVLFGIINYFVYGKFIINEMQYSSFTRTYSLLCNIDTGEKIPKVKLSNIAIEKAFEASPTFRELKPFYDGAPGELWRGASKSWAENELIPAGEIGASHSMWALRNCVSELGRYDSPKHADEFYDSVIKELEEAEYDGRLKMKHGFNVPLFSTLNRDEIFLLYNDFMRTFRYVIAEKDMHLEMRVNVPNANINLVEKVTRSRCLRDYEFKGWAILKNDEIKLDVYSSSSEKDYPVKKEEAEDVKRHFASKGYSVDDKNVSRFTIKLPYGEEGPFFLEIKNTNNDIVEKIPIKVNGVFAAESENVIYNIEEVYFPEKDTITLQMIKHVDVTKVLSAVYAGLNEIFMILSTILILVEIVFAFRTGMDKNLCVMLLLWSFFVLRIFVIAYNTTTAYCSISYLYLSPCYPLMAAIIGLQGVMVIEYLRNRFGGKVCNG